MMIAKLKNDEALSEGRLTKEQESIIDAINHTLTELECIRNLFDNVLEPELIETAIYSEEAAMSKYAYLLGEAKKLGITYNEVTYKEIV